MSKNYAIKIEHMSKSFKRVFDKPTTLKDRVINGFRTKAEMHTVLSDINLTINKGESVALIGTNGSGKSTLLKLMTRILYPNSGDIKVEGKVTSLLELGAGFHPDFTGRENIYFNAAIFGLSREQIDLRMDDIINFSEISAFIDNPVRTYSSGMYMRLAFSIAINVDADILLIDEILAVGDQRFQEKCFAKLEEYKNSDKTIVIVSHSLDVVAKLCDRGIWIYQGEVRNDGPIVSVIEDYIHQVSAENPDGEIEGVRGIIHVDQPTNFSNVYKNEQILLIRGWELSFVHETEVRVRVNDVYLKEVNRYPRADVLSTHENEFGGKKMNPNCGWEVDCDLSELPVGLNNVTLELFDINQNKLISKKEMQFFLKGE